MSKTKRKTSDEIMREYREKVLFKNLNDALAAYVALHELDNIKGTPPKARKKG